MMVLDKKRFSVSISHLFDMFHQRYPSCPRYMSVNIGWIELGGSI
jgi:hypothetical protein